MNRVWVIVLCAAASAALAGRARAAGHWTQVAEQVAAEIDHAESAAAAGHAEEAKEAVISGYFNQFEQKKMEIAERSALGIEHVSAVEALFHDLHKAIGAKRGTADLHSVAEALRQSLRSDGKALDAAGIGPDGLAGGK